MKTLLLASAFAVAFAGFAGAAEVQNDKAPVVKAQKMSDSEMDKVTAAGGGGHAFIYSGNPAIGCCGAGGGGSAGGGGGGETIITPQGNYVSHGGGR
jgi:hypothetical protein